VSTTSTYTKLETGGRDTFFSVAVAAPDRILTIVPTPVGGFIPISQLTSFLARTMAPDGTGVAAGAFYDRGAAQVNLHNGVWVDPYFYVAWHEQPSMTTWLGRLDHDGKAVGAPLALGSQGAAVHVGAGGKIAVAYMGTAKSAQETVLRFVDPGSFTLGPPITLSDDGANSQFVPTDVAVLGDTVAVAGYGVTLAGTRPGVMLATAAGPFVRQDFTLGSPISNIAANGGTFLVCSADRDGSFGVGRDAFHQWCRTLSADGALGPRAELGYRSNFLSIPAIAYGGGFAVSLPGGVKSAVGLTDAWQNLAILGLDGALKEQFDVKLPSPGGDSSGPPIVAAGGCLGVVHFDVPMFNAPSDEHSALQRYCDAPCP
jgi:hypothetical protein